MLRARRERADGSEVSYRVYLAIMLAVIVVFPLLRAVAIALVPVLPAPSQAPGIAAILSLLTALCVLAGAHTGPARATLPAIDLLHTTPLPRAHLLAGGAWRAFGLAAGIGLLLAAIVGAARLLGGELSARAALGLAAAGTGIGALAAALMLIGQAGRGARSAVAGALAVLAALQLAPQFAPQFALQFAPQLAPGSASDPESGCGYGLDPWSGFARLLAGGSWSGAVPALVAAAIVAACAPWLLGRTRRETLRDQALRWEAVSIAAVTGDPRTALARLGAPVRMFRGIRLRVSRSLTRAIVRRDLFGALRAPGRSLAGLAGLVAAGAATAWVAVGTGGGAAVEDGSRLWIAGVGGALALLAAFLATAPLARGLSAAGAGATGLLPAAPGALILRHLLVPGVVALLAMGVSAAGVLAASVPAEGVPGVLIALGEAAALAVAALLLRALAALKGTLPLRLLAPVPTPLGDMSGLNVLIWTLDGAITAALCGALVAGAWAVGAVPGAIVSALVLAGLAFWVRGRLAADR